MPNIRSPARDHGRTTCGGDGGDGGNGGDGGDGGNSNNGSQAGENALVWQGTRRKKLLND